MSVSRSLKSLLQGPFNKKENAFVVIMASASANSALGTEVLAVQRSAGITSHINILLISLTKAVLQHHAQSCCLHVPALLFSTTWVRNTPLFLVGSYKVFRYGIGGMMRGASKLYRRSRYLYALTRYSVISIEDVVPWRTTIVVHVRCSLRGWYGCTEEAQSLLHRLRHVSLSFEAALERIAN
jgi:hypothetical protein